MKTLLSSAALVFAILAVTAANPVGESNVVEILMDAELTNIDDGVRCFSFSEIVPMGGGMLVFAMDACYPNDHFMYEGEFTIDTYTRNISDSYYVYIGAQECSAPLYSMSSYFYNSWYYKDHSSHEVAFGPNEGFYSSFRPKVMVTCVNAASSCYLAGAVCLSAFRTSYEWWVYVCICVGALLVVALIALCSIVISRRASRKKASTGADSDREPLTAQQQYPSYAANPPMGYPGADPSQPPVGAYNNAAYPPSGNN